MVNNRTEAKKAKSFVIYVIVTMMLTIIQSLPSFIESFFYGGHNFVKLSPQTCIGQILFGIIKKLEKIKKGYLWQKIF